MNSMTKKPEPIPDPTSDGFAPNGANRKAILNRNILDAAPAKLLSIIATKVEVIRQIAMNWSGLQPFFSNIMKFKQLTNRSTMQTA